MNKTTFKPLKQLAMLLIAAPLFALSACTSISDDSSEDAAAVEDRSGQAGGYEGQTGGYDSSGVDGGSAISGSAINSEALSDPNSPLSVRTIYFEHDSVTINSQGQSTLNVHAEFLSLNADQKLIIEGHTDENGTREYNLSLGERRSRAVHDFLSASGVSEQQMEVRSYGEENPVVMDQGESAWQLNRRVELIY